MSATSVSTIEHRALGAMLRLTLTASVSFDLTSEEARILSRALAAVAEGKSKVDEIYMSPIASDRDFSAKVGADGLVLEVTDPPLGLSWPEVATLAAALAARAG